MSWQALVTVSLLAGASLRAQGFSAAIAAFERGDNTSAEAMLQRLLARQPNDPAALGLLGAVLDSEKKYPEADAAFRHALHLTPPSAALLNNYANHQLAEGDLSGARATYLKAIALDPARANANLQLASMAVQKKDGAGALRYLAHLSTADAAMPQIQILQMQALFLAGRKAEAEAILTRLSTLGNDPRLNFTLGLALTSAEKYNEAESSFSRALEAAPANFDILYNLGLAAYHAGHLDRARETLETARIQHPQDIDTLYNLAAIDIDLKQPQDALRLLTEANRIDPARADVELRLAQTASALGFYADARLSYERYLKLAPADDSARREYDFMVAASLEPQQGLADLQHYVSAHPADATARYEVGLLEAKTDPSDAAAQFAKALTLQPAFAPTRLGRGVLNLLQGDPSAALPDLEFAAAQYPDNSSVLDRLGEAYMALNRSDDAVRTLKKASQIAPRDARVLMHLSRALTKAGQTEEASAVLVRFRAIGPQSGNLIPLPGFVEFLSLSPEQQQLHYREEVEKRLSKDPNDAELHLRYLKLLAGEGRAAKVAAEATRLLALSPPMPLAADAGHALVNAGFYADAKPLLEYAAASAVMPAVPLDFAIALFHTSGAVQGMAELERIPEPERSADFYLARAQMLDAAGKLDAALEDLRRAVQSAPKQPELYAAEASFFVRHARPDEAIQLLGQACTALPDNRLLLLAKAEVLSAANRSPDAERTFKEIENRWPEWAPAYVSYGRLLQDEKRSEEAKIQLDTASALGSASGNH